MSTNHETTSLRMAGPSAGNPEQVRPTGRAPIGAGVVGGAPTGPRSSGDAPTGSRPADSIARGPSESTASVNIGGDAAGRVREISASGDDIVGAPAGPQEIPPRRLRVQTGVAEGAPGSDESCGGVNGGERSVIVNPLSSGKKMSSVELRALARYYAELAEAASAEEEVDSADVGSHAESAPARETASGNVASPAIVATDAGRREKGKTADPGNWGNLSFTQDWNDSDIEAQRRGLQNFAEIKRISAAAPKHAPEAPCVRTAQKASGSRVHVKDQEPAMLSAPDVAQKQKLDVPGQVTTGDIAQMFAQIRRLEQMVATQAAGQNARQSTRRARKSQVREEREHRPATRGHTVQLAPESFIAKAIRGVSRVNSAPPSDPSSGSSSSESESGTDTDDSQFSARQQQRRSTKYKARRMRIRPKEPGMYDGAPNATAFYRFVRESAAYVDLGRIPAHRQTFQVSYFLQAKATDFYNQVVVQNESNYDLTRFFDELFDFCFPVDFRRQQRRALDELWQDDRTVAATIALFSEIWNTIGIEDSQEKIVKLWNCFNDDIQMELYRDKLDPERSTWDDVVRGAKRAEVIVNLACRSYESPSDTEETESTITADADTQDPPIRPGGRVEPSGIVNPQKPAQEAQLEAQAVEFTDEQHVLYEPSEVLESLGAGAAMFGGFSEASNANSQGWEDSDGDDLDIHTANTE